MIVWDKGRWHYSKQCFHIDGSTFSTTFPSSTHPYCFPPPFLFALVKIICCCCPRNEPLSRITVKICVFCGPFKGPPPLVLPPLCVWGMHCCCRLYLAVIIIKMSKIISSESIDERLKCSINARNALNDSEQWKRGEGEEELLAGWLGEGCGVGVIQL